MVLPKVKLVITAAVVVAALAAGAVALIQSRIGRPQDVAPASQNQNSANSSGANSSRSENDQESRKIVLTSPKAMEVTITLRYVCQIRAQSHVDVYASENGYLNEIKVREGQAVKKGDLMFKIVPILKKANLDAESANVKASFDGIVGRLQERKGGLIKEGDFLTTLSDNSVMWVYFNVPERQYLEYLANREQHEKEDRIELLLANQDRFPEPGRFCPREGFGAIEGGSSETGDIVFRAEFPNPDRRLRHGQTGTILIHRKLHDAIVIPQRASFEMIDKRYVYVVDKDDVVHRREIVVRNETDDIFVIKKGVAVGDRIVIGGNRQVYPGEKVESRFLPPEEVMRKLRNQSE